MKFEIKSARNGWVVKQDDEIIVCQDMGNDEYEATVSMLWMMLETYGPSGSKHNKKNIRVSIAPGYSYDGDIEDEYFTEILSNFDNLLSSLSSVLEHRREIHKSLPVVPDYMKDVFELVESYRKIK